MAVKFDKEALLKNRFWIMLGVAVPMILFALYVLRVDIASGIETQRKKANQAFIDIKKYDATCPSQAEIDKLQQEVNKANAEVGVVWSNVFKEQIPYMFWPEKFEKDHPFETGKFIREIKPAAEGATNDANHFIGKVVGAPAFHYVRVKGGKDNKEEVFYRTEKFDQQFKDIAADMKVDIFYQTARYFNDPLNVDEQSEYKDYYLKQIRKILDLVQPVKEDGEGIVQLRGWLATNDDQAPGPQVAAATRFLRWVPNWNIAVNISDEAWMAQEDLWIQQDIYQAIKDANEQVSLMHGTSADGLNKTASFKNPYFEIGLTLLSDTKLKVNLKNLRDNRQKLEIAFKIRMAKDPKAEWERVYVEGEPLDPTGAKKDSMTKEITLPPGKRTGVYEVEQVLTWETAAVRRIDYIAIGSGATDDMSLNNRLFPDGVRSLNPPLVVEKKEEGDRREMMRQDLMNKAALGLNGVVKDRYIEVNEQARRLPVGVALIVDQVHLGRILKSFENTKFRFIINQTLVNRYPESLRPKMGNKDQPGVPAAFPRRDREGRFGPRPIVGTQPGEETFESNVELVIYGVVTMYQRFPPRPAATAPENVAKQP